MLESQVISLRAHAQVLVLGHSPGALVEGRGLRVYRSIKRRFGGIAVEIRKVGF